MSFHFYTFFYFILKLQYIILKCVFCSLLGKSIYISIMSQLEILLFFYFFFFFTWAAFFFFLQFQMYLTSDVRTFRKCALRSRLQEVNLDERECFLSWWKLVHFDPQERLEHEGLPVPVSVFVSVIKNLTRSWHQRFFFSILHHCFAPYIIITRLAFASLSHRPTSTWWSSTARQIRLWLLWNILSLGTVILWIFALRYAQIYFTCFLENLYSVIWWKTSPLEVFIVLLKCSRISPTPCLNSRVI